jgi:hypothetical protein
LCLQPVWVSVRVGFYCNFWVIIVDENWIDVLVLGYLFLFNIWGVTVGLPLHLFAEKNNKLVRSGE